LLTTLPYSSLISEVDQLNEAKSAKQGMKIISKKYWQDIKNFVDQIPLKFEGFY